MRVVFYIIALLFLSLIYWSSTNVEKDLKTIQSELDELKAEMAHLATKKVAQSEEKNEAHRYHSKADSNLPSLLTVDPFFEDALPKMIGADFKPKGTLKEALLGLPEHLHPFNGFRNVASIQRMCVPTIAEAHVGMYEIFAPSAASKIEKRNDTQGREEYWVHLRNDLFWEPLKQEHFPSSLILDSHFLKKHPVTSKDFKLFFDAVMNPHVSESKAVALRNYYGDIEAFRIIDDFTFAIRWKAKKLNGEKVKYSSFSLTCALQPLAAFVFQHFPDGKKIVPDDSDPETYRNHSIWAQNFTHHFAKNVIPSCGPWIFDGKDDERIKLKRNPNYFNPLMVLVDEHSFIFKQSTEGIWQDFKSGKIDLCTLVPSHLNEYGEFLKSPLYKTQEANGQKIKEIDFVDPAYAYIGWNEATPFFKSAKVRKAMTLAIDRNRLILQNLNEMGLPITGPFFIYSPSYDPSIQALPYSPADAQDLLEEEGWSDLDGDGIREKMINGKKVVFRFTLIYYAKNLATKVMCEVIATALREVGVLCQPTGLDLADLSSSFNDKSFDAIYLAWALGTPPEDPKQLWHSSGAKEKGSSNAVGFENKEIDEIIEKLQYEYDSEKRISLYHQFHKIIYEELPYTFLYSPKTKLLYRENVKNLFIPNRRQDLIPGAESGEPEYRFITLQ